MGIKLLNINNFNNLKLMQKGPHHSSDADLYVLKYYFVECISN